MKSIKIHIVLLIVLFLIHINLSAQTEPENSNRFAISAMSQAVSQYHQSQFVGYKKYMVVCMKIMTINEMSGEFVLNYILNDYDYDDIFPGHYMRVNNELVLIKSDSLCKSGDFEKYGIHKITKEIKNEALAILAHNLAISGPSDLMVFRYDKNKLEGQFYDSNTPIPLDKKYRFY